MPAEQKVFECHIKGWEKQGPFLYAAKTRSSARYKCWWRASEAGYTNTKLSDIRVKICRDEALTGGYRDAR